MAALSSWWIMVPVRSARPRWRWGVLWGLRDTHCSTLWRWSPRGPSAAPPKTWTQWNWRWGRSDARQRRFSQRLCPCLRICSSVLLQQMIPHRWNPEVSITSTEETCRLRSSLSTETWWERRNNSFWRWEFPADQQAAAVLLAAQSHVCFLKAFSC